MTAMTLTGSLRLVRLGLRRDRILLPVWIASLAGLTAAVAASIIGLYATMEERVAAASFGAANPVTRVFDGPASGTELGAMVMVEAFLLLAILVAIMSSQAVVRHTRLDEETGRAELLESSVVGRHARLTAALVVAVVANLLVGTGVALALIANGLGVTGSAVAGASLVGVGVVFAGIAAITSQVLSTARGANGAAGAVLGVAFLLRAVGDLAGEVASSGVELVSAWPSWLSPIGWGHQMRPYHQDNWEVLALFGALAVVLVGVAFWLTSHRDVGAGMVPPPPGAARAGPRLRSPLGLAWRLQRGVLVAWAVGLALAGAAFGAVGESADEVVGISEQLEQALRAMAPEGGMVELYFTFMMGFLGIAAAGYTVQALLRMRAEEATGRLEPVLATATGRWRWLASHVLIAVVGTVALLVLMGLAGAIAYGAATGDWVVGLEGLVGGALVQAPAALALGGFVVAAFAVAPRWAPALGWGALAVSLVVGQVGALLDLPQAALNLSPFTHVPAVPAQPFEVLPLALLLAAAIALAGVGFVAFRRRDLAIAA